MQDVLKAWGRVDIYFWTVSLMERDEAVWVGGRKNVKVNLWDMGC
jgi:hypothetical protein